MTPELRSLLHDLRLEVRKVSRLPALRKLDPYGPGVTVEAYLLAAFRRRLLADDARFWKAVLFGTKRGKPGGILDLRGKP